MADAAAASSDWNVYVVCASLLVLFAGYNTSQELTPKLLGSEGRVIVAVFYCSATVVGPAVPFVVQALGKRLALFLSGLAYVAYVASLSYLVLPLSVGLAVVLGIAAAVLFTVAPAEVNSCVAAERRGWANSLTWASLRLSAVPGNLLALWLLERSSSTAPAHAGGASGAAAAHNGTAIDVTKHGWTDSSPVFVGLAALCLLGAFVLLLVRIATVPPPPAATVQERERDDERGGGDGDGGTFVGMLIGGEVSSSTLRSLLPLFFFSGLNIGLIYGCLPALMPLLLVPKAYIVIAVAEVAGSIGSGRLADSRLGSSAVLWIALAVEGAAVFCVCLVAAQAGVDGASSGAADGGWLLASALLGLADSGFQSQAYTVTGGCFSDELKVGAFAVFGVLQHLGLAAAWVAVSVWEPADSVTSFCAYWVVCGLSALAAVAGSHRALLLAQSSPTAGPGKTVAFPAEQKGGQLTDSLLPPAE